MGHIIRSALAAVTVALLYLGWSPAFACGPSFPNYLLREGDRAVLGGAELCFARELARMDLVPSRHKAVLQGVPYAQEAHDAELNELQVALRALGVNGEESARIVSAHATARKKLTAFAAELKVVEDSRPYIHIGSEVSRGDPTLPFPRIADVALTPGLPGEFADYFEGALAWYDPAINSRGSARKCWERLLARPEKERKFRSVWAAFMLGRSWIDENPQQAKEWFRKTRAFASSGFHDSIGLAASSLGVEARIELLQTNYIPAIDLYVEQLAAGDRSAVASLRFLAVRVLRSDEVTLRALAANPRAQRVITAYVLAQPSWQNDGESEEDEDNPSPAMLRRRWLLAIEAAGVKDAESVEKFALAAYQANDMAQAQRWIKVSPKAPICQWLNAKLLLRAGKSTEAAKAFTQVVHAFPVQPRGTNESVPLALKDTLMAGTCEGNMIPVERQVLGELGVIRLARREYVQALDALLNAGFWMDAAYVAERVLTLQELKDYVDCSWPTVSGGQIEEETQEFGTDPVSPARLRSQIRYLLARRLSRSFRTDEAQDYYPAEWVPQFSTFIQELRYGWEQSVQPNERAAALFRAAIISRTNGMELIGTEVEPDWHIHDGQFAEGVSIEDRKTISGPFLVASADELSRASQHKPDPDTRFHYRYQAASLAWEAARLLPDNSDFTAYVLWKGGSWLKSMDPPAADLFYKSLVNRNRRTALGAEADRRRWFPLLDEQGNILPSKPSTIVEPPDDSERLEEEVNPTEQGEAQMDSGLDDEAATDARFGSEGSVSWVRQRAAFRYIVHRGDTFGHILRALEKAGLPISQAELLDANPGLNPTKLLIGQVIRVPVFEE